MDKDACHHQQQQDGYKKGGGFGVAPEYMQDVGGFRHVSGPYSITGILAPHEAAAINTASKSFINCITNSYSFYIVISTNSIPYPHNYFNDPTMHHFRINNAQVISPHPIKGIIRTTVGL